MNTLIKIDKPWDAQLAFRMVYPLRNSKVRPNHLTTLRLLFGVTSAWLFSYGGGVATNLAAFTFLVSNFLDHADGELARLTGHSSEFGHIYDLASDAAINILLFVGIGVGLRTGQYGDWAIAMGIVAGLSVSGIFHLRHLIEQRVGKPHARQPHFAGFEAEDVLYLLPVVTLLHGLPQFLMAAAIGAPCFALFVIYEYRKLHRSEK